MEIEGASARPCRAAPRSGTPLTRRPARVIPWSLVPRAGPAPRSARRSLTGVSEHIAAPKAGLESTVTALRSDDGQPYPSKCAVALHIRAVCLQVRASTRRKSLHRWRHHVLGNR
jgi:hypothetical protein